MYRWLARSIIVLGHRVSALGCWMRGFHIRREGKPLYCALCGRKATRFYKEAQHDE